MTTSGYTLGTTDTTHPFQWNPRNGDGPLHIVAAAGNGRTTLARSIAHQAHALGHRVIVLDGADGIGWEPLERAGATVLPARVSAEHDQKAQGAKILTTLRTLDVQESRWGEDTPDHRTLLVLDNANMLLRAPREPQDRKDLLTITRDLGFIRAIGLVVVGHLLTELRDIDGTAVESYALSRVSRSTLRLLRWSGPIPPVDLGRFLVSTPTQGAHPITVPKNSSGQE